MNIQRAFILAAGLGLRMRPLTLYTPKPLLSVNNKPLIEYHLEKLAKAGIKEVVINISHLAEQIQKKLGNGDRWGLRIYYSVEPLPFETAGGISHAQSYLKDEPFLCVNGDVYIDYPFEKLLELAGHFPADLLAYLVMVENPSHHLEGDFSLVDLVSKVGPSSTDEKQSAVKKVVMKELGCPSVTFSGLSILHPRLFVGLDQTAGKLAPLLIGAMKKDRVLGECYSGHWCDVGTIERLQSLDAFLRAVYTLRH
jgi:N-acetyl-alpha-D-muramate 1-phosphate uridylyltransferase